MTKDNNELPLWRVIHLSYPREKQEHSYLKLSWFSWHYIKLPKFSIEKKTSEKPGASVDHELLCQHIELLLNSDEMKEYDLFSLSSTYSGSFAITQLPVHPHQQFLRRHAPTGMLAAKEALIVILKRKK